VLDSELVAKLTRMPDNLPVLYAYGSTFFFHVKDCFSGICRLLRGKRLASEFNLTMWVLLPPIDELPFQPPPVNKIQADGNAVDYHRW